MAFSSGSAINKELQCSICLEVFTDPVSTPCGHNFCRTCLSKCWTSSRNCFCPFCKEKFSRRPDLKINTTLREVVQHFEKRKRAESEVFCDFSDERKQKAVKSCLTCQSSYCDDHLEPHLRVPRLKKHKLINAVENLEDYICQKHERPLEMFCRDDQTCVCLSCTEGEHRNHNTVPIEEESREKKINLANRHHQMIQDRIKKIQEIQDSVELRKRNTEKEKSFSVELFTDLIRSFERCQSEQLKMMEEQQKAAEKQAEDLIKELQQEITELKKRNTELEQLSHTDDHLHLIQMCSFLFSLPHTKNWTEIRIDSDVNANSLYRVVTLLRKTQETLNKKIRQTELKCVQKYAVDVTLDPDTANPYLILSDYGKQVSTGDIKQDVPENPKRFDVCFCVLSKQGFSSGRFYYEVQVKGKTEWSLGVARESINRKVKITLGPDNGFWTVIQRNENRYKACESPSVSLSLKVKLEKVGVFVDYEEGLVSFYDVSSSSHIYSYTGQTFTEKLYPYFYPGFNSKNSNPLIITPVN
ncbi:E3 ubiquitin-protein ligase TRIM39-like [Ctenopharyngodon idella]|uniref:E3 ubiquitin-protein ligase TRIM39-like n=1 Tax=Ctenopharyngodon idella TaxID=7959 RepID=UPI00222E248F|nr:E3 ubiquitin-protein ligase TRIM39-like [Ctenopharyngodon idella]